MKNILINLPPSFFTQPELAPIFARLEEHGTVRKTSHDKPEALAPDMKWADVVLMWSWPRLDDAGFEAAGPIEFIGHIDLGQSLARTELARGIPLSLSKGGWSPAVAEMALGLTLSCLRRISHYHAAMKAGNEEWVRQLPGDLDRRERQLTGASVAVVGLGQVGRRFAELLGPFEVDLHVVDPYIPNEVLGKYGGRRVTIEEATEQCEVIVLCAAANPGTDRLLNADRIRAMRPNAVLINVARARLIDMEALAERLGQGDLIAALDVFEEEPLPRDAAIRRLPNLYLTPHRAGGLMVSVLRTINWLIDDYERLVAGQPRNYAVTEKMVPLLDG